jgi:toxin YhaV
VSGSATPVQRHGWTLLRTAAFAHALDGLEAEVAKLAAKDPASYSAHPKAKLLKRIVDLTFEEIPRDPNAPAFQLGNTLGASHRHWRRAKFLQRFRLFFRFDSAAKVIVYAWVNNETTLRKAGSRSDPYAVFLRRLEAGDPPDDWMELMEEAETLR